MRPGVGHTHDFDSLQRAMATRLGHRGVSDLTDGTIVVLPSLSFPESELRKIIGIQYYEERLLCMALLLHRPRLEIVYVTSMPIEDAIIDYYLRFVSAADDDLRRRLHLISVGDPATRGLSAKLIERPDVLDDIAAAIGNRDAGVVFPFNVSHDEQRVAEALGIGIYGPRPDHAALGSKSGGRRVAAAAGVPIPPGAGNLMSLEEVEDAAFALLRDHPECSAIVIKLNNGFSGQGNVVIAAGDLASPLTESRATFCASEESWATFGPKVAADGAVVEAFVSGIASPSVQLRIMPDSSYEIVSTHDQILGGPDDQVYLGCRFPAATDYRAAIQGYGLALARELALHGVVGSFGVDFIVLADGAIYMTEINLRLGGTTHPFLMARFATGGTYDMSTGELRAGDGVRAYVATDNIKSSRLLGMAAADVVRHVDEAGLAFDPASGTGVTLHLLGATRYHGKLGALCIEADLRSAERTYLELLGSFGL